MNRVAIAVIVGILGSIAALIAITDRGEPAGPASDTVPIVESDRVGPQRDGAPAVAPRTTKPATTGVFAERGYERLLHNQREAVMRVTWSWVEHKGARVIRDVTVERRRTARDMGGHIDVFEESVQLNLLRTQSGDLIRMHTERQYSDRVDTETVTRTETGYDVAATTGDNEESFHIATDAAAHVDAEAFLVPKIRAGEAKAGSTYTMRALSTAQRKVIDVSLVVIGQDDEGPGLKVIETVMGQRMLWWFANDGAVVRNRAGDRVIRRADNLTLKDLPRRPAVYPITLEANIDLPRLFTNRKMVVDVVVDTDDTVRPPAIPKNPFTDVIRSDADTVRLLLKEHDDPEANAPYPCRPAGPTA